jgi:hypothetical protein
MLLAAIVLTLVSSAPEHDAKLSGSWGVNGQLMMKLESNGTGTMSGQSVKWSTSHGVLRAVGANGQADEVAYTLDGDGLTLTMNGVPVRLERLGGAGAAAKASSPPATSAGAGAGSDALSKLLVSSLWCSFSYKSGTTRTKKTQFLANGTWSQQGNRETSWSGSNGSFYGSSGSGAAGRWAVKDGQLLLSAPPQYPDLVPVPIQVTRNSNGYPIITNLATKEEWSQCN